MIETRTRLPKSRGRKTGPHNFGLQRGLLNCLHLETVPHLAQTQQLSAEGFVAEFLRSIVSPRSSSVSSFEKNRSKRYGGLRPERVSRIMADTARPGRTSLSMAHGRSTTSSTPIFLTNAATTGRKGTCAWDRIPGITFTAHLHSMPNSYQNPVFFSHSLS